MSTEAQTEQRVGLHGGRLVAKRLKAHGVTKLFTLSGGHLFSIFDGCREEGIDIVDVRHEQTAVFAAEGWAKATREPGVCALTAGPGVTNGMSGMASALQNGSPLLVLGGRAPALRWGQGSLQEIDHVPFVAPLTKLAQDGAEHRRHPRARGRGPQHGDGGSDRAYLPRLPARPRVHGGGGGRGRARRAARSRTGAGGRRRRDRTRGRAAARRRAAGDHGRHRSVLGPRRGGAAGAGGGARDPRVPERPGARLRARRPSSVLLPRARDRAQGRGRGAGGGRADGLPPGLRWLVRRRDPDRRGGLGSAGAPPSSRGGRRALRRAFRRRSEHCARPPPAGPSDRPGPSSCARWRTRSAAPSRTT